ncbi:glycosyltransferase involved in cell wall biosynthesis [Crossiella equi]|uniref:Glycosyltransferase involved in cell wall biosynthesis n=1 Tax=Crossiella equi TaxID=130796 RepID=A0ABS5ABG1_9PSEU|nr:glycosyltransferase [Crossiella equi]MBP2473929.1 glycosyltransferase involved in cell wall biosynthesis [Crossiella equi]
MTTPRVCFVTTYPLGRAELGGSGWVDRRLVAVLREAGCEVEVVCVTGPPGQWAEQEVVCHAAGEVPLEIRGDRAKLLRVAAGMALTEQPYLSRKFTAFPGWRQAARLLAERAAGRAVVTSGWPGLLLAEAAGVPVAAHVAHNVETTIALEHSPRPLRLLGETWRLPKAERRLLSLPHKVFALSRTDAELISRWAAPAEPLPLVVRAAPEGLAARSVGFIGKASWPPNERALESLLGPVHEELARLSVDVKYVLAGSGTEQYRDHPRTTALGRVERESEFYRQVGLVVVPRFGASTGISVKMLEATEYGLPSVVPPQLAEAVDPAGPWLVADGPAETAAAIGRWARGEVTVDVPAWVAAHDGTATARALLGALQVG